MSQPLLIDPSCYVPSPTCARFIAAAKEGPVDEMRLLILRGPRGVGKCLTSDATVLRVDGQLQAIPDMTGEAVLALGDGYSFKTAESLPAQDFGSQPCLTIETRSGYRITGNYEHPVLTLDGWVPISRLAVGDHVAAMRECPIQGETPLPPWIPEFLGLIIGDGTATGHNSVGFAGRDPTVRALLQTVTEHYGWRMRTVGADLRLSRGANTKANTRYCCRCQQWLLSTMFTPHGGYCRLCMSAYNSAAYYHTPRGKGISLQDVGPVITLKRLGVYGATAHNKRVPEAIFTAPNNQVAAFVGCYFACDGHVAASNRSAEFYSVSRPLLSGVKHLLLRFGVLSVLTKKRGRYRGHVHMSWRLRIAGAAFHEFALRIPIPGEKGWQLGVVASQTRRSNPNMDIVPTGWQRWLRHGEKWFKLRGFRFGRWRHGNSRETVRRAASLEGNAHLLTLATAPIFWDRVVACSDAGHKRVWNVEVLGTHTFIADGGLITHNTTAGIWAHVALADRLVNEGGEALPLRSAVIRDTWENLNRTTLLSFEENAKRGLEIHFLNGRKEAVIGPEDSPSVHFYFFGLDHPEDVDKLQGFQCGVLWPEEVAPAAGVSGGIPSSVMLGGTSVRQAGVPPRILVTMNPPDKNHWIVKVEEVLAEQDLAYIKVRHFTMDAREKSAHFLSLAAMATEQDDSEGASGWHAAAQAFDRYTDRNRVLLESIGRHDLVVRLVEGEIGEVRMGASVVPNFSRALHVAKSPIQIVRGVEIVRGIDSGVNDLHPAVVYLQVGVDWINVLGSLVGTNLSFEEFIRQQMWPFEQKYRLFKAKPRAPVGESWSQGKGFTGASARGGFTFRNIGDPAMFATDGRSARTAALVFEMLVKESVEPGPVEWGARRESLYAAFGRKGPRDRLMVQIDPEENEILIDGLAGRFHYPEQKATGEIIADITSAKRVSGIFSHPVDGLGYAIAVLFPAHEWAVSQMRERSPSPPPRAAGSWLGR